MFRRFGFDVAGIIKPGETNRLAVRIERIPPELVHILAASDGAMSGGGENYPKGMGSRFLRRRHQRDAAAAERPQKPDQLRLGLGRQHLHAGHLAGRCAWKRAATRALIGCERRLTCPTICVVARVKVKLGNRQLERAADAQAHIRMSMVMERGAEIERGGCFNARREQRRVGD